MKFLQKIKAAYIKWELEGGLDRKNQPTEAEKCTKNLREDKLKALIDNKKFKYKSIRHNPNHFQAFWPLPYEWEKKISKILSK